MGIFGVDKFKTIMDLIGIWPYTIIDIQHNRKEFVKLKKIVGDFGQDRHAAVRGIYDSFWSNSNKNISIFNPQLAAYICKLYMRENAIVFDPFGGGGTRAIISLKLNAKKYTGIEIRENECRRVNRQLSNLNLKNGKIICADSQNLKNIVKSNSHDFLITCPPYYNLEAYNGGKNDLSMSESYQDFLNKIGEIIKETKRVLKPNSISCWVIGLHRDYSNKERELLHIPQDIASIHKKLGFYHKEEAIINNCGTGSQARVGNFLKGKGFLIRKHEYLEVFVNKK